MQLFCSLGFEFASSLSITTMTSGDSVGCDNWGCQLTLGGFCLFTICGAWNQVTMERLMLRMEEKPELQGNSWYQEKLVMINTMFGKFSDASSEVLPVEKRTPLLNAVLTN